MGKNIIKLKCSSKVKGVYSPVLVGKSKVEAGEESDQRKDFSLKNARVKGTVLRRRLTTGLYKNNKWCREKKTGISLWLFPR